MEIELAEIRKIELEILNYLKTICNKHKLKYYLYAGSLAGAVYYEDFLPGDNDIDIALLREDYEKLMDILTKDDKYLLLTPYSNKDYYYPFAKLVAKNTKIKENSRVEIKDLGIYVDIFPMDNLPKYFKKMYLFKMRLYKSLLLSKMLSKPKITAVKHIPYLIKYYFFMIINFLFNKKDNNYLALLIEKKAKKYINNNSLYISLVNYGSRNNNYILKKEFIKQKKYKFCNQEYTATFNNKLLLEKIYSKKRKNKSREHKFVAFYR